MTIKEVVDIIKHHLFFADAIESCEVEGSIEHETASWEGRPIEVQTGYRFLNIKIKYYKRH